MAHRRNGLILIFASGIRVGERDVIIPRDYIWVLKKLKAINPFTEFVFTKNSERVKADKFRKRMYRICDALNIPRRATHTIRKTYGSILLDNDLDSRLIIGQMGHTEIAAAERSYHKSRRSREKKFDILRCIPGFQSSSNPRQKIIRAHPPPRGHML